ncbi:ABC transporter ATP-binding protein [Pseudahrensia aquimaris]|uniref:ABC transporter ATP-binding protein n=1 Tax=Pseudahrensia aquimaris TaxID=744461 RepID=A0ABW3FBE8_9HYPH
MDQFFRFFERFARPFERPDPGRPPTSGMGFIRHYASQMPGMFIAMLVLGGIVALVEAALFTFVGWVVDMMNASGPQSFFADHGATLLWMALLVGVVRAILFVATAALEEQIVVPDFFTFVRWQSHRAISRQDVSFFDEEMAGRVSSKIWQAGQAAGDFMVSLLQIIWFIAVFAFTTLVVLASLDWRLLVPVLIWFGGVAAIAFIIIPKIRDRGRATADATARVTGRIVDGYSNIRTLKLYSAENRNDAFIREAWDNVLTVLRSFTRAVSGMRMAYHAMSSVMLVIIAALALYLYTTEALSVGEVSIVLALCLRLNLLMGRMLGLLNGLFRNFGTVQNSAELIAREPTIKDAGNAKPLGEARGEIEFKQVSFAYEGTDAVIEDFNLTIQPGETVGIVGQSGVGKTTLMNLLLRFHDIDGGAITIDGTDITSVTQPSLRAQMGIVTQDTALLHRSIKDNITYGKPDATDAEVEQAARRAKAHEFIVKLKDVRGRTGYDTHVGERGVKLSGGQRQRIALARVFLKNAPILLLDEATSALDSEVEAAIQEHLADLMEGKTVVAIAHRLSTLQNLQRIIVMEEGKIVEDGTHQELLKAKGAYFRLWERQSGGFVGG